MHYRIHDPPRRHKFGASAARLFTGWRFEDGFVFRGVIFVLDYEAVKAQALRYWDTIPVPFAEVHVPDETTFPLHAAADLALN